MKIYTGYFAKTKVYEQKGLRPIAIALYPPEWFSGHQYLPLAPKGYMMSRTMPAPVFDREYKKHVLGVCNQKAIVQQLERISDGQDIVLLCFERLQKECHRALVAEWLNKAGFDVQEYDLGENKKPVATQLGLF